jgi:CBS domain-containing protein
MSAGRICVRDVDLADPGESAWEAAARMHQRAVGALVVLNDSREPIGIITDRDLVERVLSPCTDPQSTPVSEIMTPSPKTISEDDSIEAALTLMRSGRFRRLPVVDRDGKLVGLLTLDDILMLLAEELAQVGQLLERETPRAVATQ